MSEVKDKILVVDDDEIILIALSESLTQHGFQVLALSNPVEALAKLRNENFAVIISDQRMAEMNGLDFLALCKEIQPDASRILITGVQNIKTLIQAVNKSEIYRFVGKPWIREELMDSIKNAVARHQKATALKKQTAFLQQEIESLRKEIESLKR